MESWRNIWRNGFAPSLSTTGLVEMRKALKADDDRILQGASTVPLALPPHRGNRPRGACALSYCGWRGEDLRTVGEVENYLADLCAEADERLGEPAACRDFLNWYDDTPRAGMRRDLLAEVERTLRDRFPVAPARITRRAA